MNPSKGKPRNARRPDLLPSKQGIGVPGEPKAFSLGKRNDKREEGGSFAFVRKKGYGPDKGEKMD